MVFVLTFQAGGCCGLQLKWIFNGIIACIFNPLWSGVHIKYYKLFIIWLGLSGLNCDMFSDFTLAIDQEALPSISHILKLYYYIVLMISHAWLSKLGVAGRGMLQRFDLYIHFILSVLVDTVIIIRFFFILKCNCAC